MPFSRGIYRLSSRCSFERDEAATDLSEEIPRLWTSYNIRDGSDGSGLVEMTSMYAYLPRHVKSRPSRPGVCRDRLRQVYVPASRASIGVAELVSTAA
jgi:hypothetical protein